MTTPYMRCGAASCIREQIGPAILAVATILIVFAAALLFTVWWLRRRAAGTG